MLKLERVKKQYKNFTLDCSLEVRPGCITGLIGQNGAGKSTTFKAALGLIRTDGGTMEVFGKNSRELTEKERQKLGVVLSDAGFSEFLLGKDVVSVMQAMYPKFEKERFLSRCKEFQIPMDKKIKEFSTGMKAKLKVLLALSHDAQSADPGRTDSRAGCGGKGRGAGSSAGIYGREGESCNLDQFPHFQ